MPGGAVEVTAVFAESGAVSALPFIDVRVDNWFYGAVKYAYENGLMVGTGVDIFSPDGTLTRAQAVTVLWRLENEPQVNYAMNFADVANGTWYTEAVRWAASEGIVLGNGDGTFGAHNAITREQLAAILYRYAAYKGYDVTAKSDPSAFTDAFKISDWAYDAIRWAYGTKLMQGNGDGTINPTGNTRRSEFATMIMRFNEQIAK